jgi:hypothetical protein
MRQRTAKSVVIHDALQSYATAGYANRATLPPMFEPGFEYGPLPAVASGLPTPSHAENSSGSIVEPVGVVVTPSCLRLHGTLCHGQPVCDFDSRADGLRSALSTPGALTDARAPG